MIDALPPVPTPSRAKSNWPLILGAPLAVAAAWIAYSALFVDHRKPLPPALPGEKLALDTPTGMVNVYVDGAEGPPLLLIHSVNAAASVYEVRPLYLRYRKTRRVYALDLPGFGFSQRKDVVYTPRIMADAIHAATAAIKAREGVSAVDVVALSLSCEYAARAAVERPKDFSSLGFLSPTGFDKALSGDGPDGATRGSRLALSMVSQRPWSRALYDLLVSRPSMRLFLQKTWGSRRIDENLFAYDQLTTHQPGAEHAVWSFLAGYLFADDVSRLYRRLSLPVWVARGTRGDFVDYSHAKDFADRPNWKFQVFDTGAFPHFERLDEVATAYDDFLSETEAKAAAAD